MSLFISAAATSPSIYCIWRSMIIRRNTEFLHFWHLLFGLERLSYCSSGTWSHLVNFSKPCLTKSTAMFPSVANWINFSARGTCPEEGMVYPGGGARRERWELRCDCTRCFCISRLKALSSTIRIFGRHSQSCELSEYFTGFLDANLFETMT